MMNGEGPSVPITTLAGIQSLTDLLLELPLPTPLPGVTGHQSLLSHLRDSEEARRLLNTQESILIPPLIEALGCTTTDHIEVKDGYYGGASHSGQISQLVQFLLGRNPGLFKGSVHCPPSGTGDHHVAPSQWLQRQCPAIAVHPQQHTFSSAAVSPCQPRPTQGNSPNYFPLEHPPTPQGARLVQNKTLNAVPPKSPATAAAAYSQYAHTVSSSGQQHPASAVQHNAISQGSGDSLPSGLQESPQMFNSPLINQHIAASATQSSPAVHPFSNGDCVDDVDLAAVNATKQNDRTENHILNPVQQVLGNAAANCSPLISPQNTPNDMSLSSPSSSSSTPQHLNSSSVIVGPSVPIVNCMKKTSLEQWPSVHDSSVGSSQPEAVKADVNTIPVTPIEPHVKPLPVPEHNKKVVVEKSKTEKVNNDKKGNSVQHILRSPERRKSVTEPVVVLSKLSIEDQLLAQKSVKQFTIKSKKNETSPELSKIFQNKNSEISSRRKSTANKEPEVNAKTSPRKKVKNNEYFSSRKNSDISKEKEKEKGTKRSHSAIGGKVNNNASSLGERVKKRRRRSQQTSYVESPGSDNDNDSGEESFKETTPPPVQVVVTPKAKKLKNKKIKKELACESLSVEDLMDTNTYQHFSRTVDSIFDSMEDLDFSAVVDEDAECPAEALIPLHQLQDLSNEAAKLKRLRAMNQFPPERLVRLLSILERNIIDGAKLLPVQSMEEQDEDEARLWLELTMERVMRSADASLTALYVMTSPKMPEKVFLE